MTIFQVVSLGVVITSIILLIKPQKPEFALVLAIATGVFILLVILPQMNGVVETITSISQKAGVDQAYISIMLKSLGIAYITNLGAELCRDAGQAAIAVKMELAGKILIAVLALPVIEAIFNLVVSII